MVPYERRDNMSNQPPNSRKNDYKQRLKVAKNRNILDVAQALGMNLEKRGGTYVWSEHDSLVIFQRKIISNGSHKMFKETQLHLLNK